MSYKKVGFKTERNCLYGLPHTNKYIVCKLPHQIRAQIENHNREQKIESYYFVFMKYYQLKALSSYMHTVHDQVLQKPPNVRICYFRVHLFALRRRKNLSFYKNIYIACFNDYVRYFASNSRQTENVLCLIHSLKGSKF